MKRLASAVLLAGVTGAWLAAAGPVFAAFETDAGVSGAQFLKIGAGARALGMGEAMTACAEGPEAVYWNPGGLAAAKSLELAYARADLPASAHHDYAALALPMARAGGVFGFAFTRLSQEAVEQIDNVGVSRGSFAPHSEAFSFAYARSFTREDSALRDRGYFRDSWNVPGVYHPIDDGSEPWTGAFRAGAAVKVISETLGTRTAASVAVDAGVSYRPSERPALSLGWALRNAGKNIKFIRDSAPIPVEFALGAAHDWESERSHVLTAIEAVAPLRARPYAKLGAQWEKGVSRDVVAVGRVGFQGRSAPDLGLLSGLTSGVGARRGGFSCDLAFQPMGDFGSAFRLGLGWKFKSR